MVEATNSKCYTLTHRRHRDVSEPIVFSFICISSFCSPFGGAPLPFAYTASSIAFK